MYSNVECDRCGRELQAETDRYEQDECFKVDGYILCEKCLVPYMREHYREELISCPNN